VSKDLNRVQLIGHIGRDPEVHYLDNGTAMITFSLATNRTWKDAHGQPQSETEWSLVVAWGRLAEIGRDYLRKGRHVYLEGRLRTRQWADQDGRTRYTTEVVAEDVLLLDSRPQEKAAVPQPEAAPPEQAHQSPPAAHPSLPAQREPQGAPSRPPRGIQSQPRSEQAPSGDQEDDENLPF
jgi:single-strand DNA-binding protein